MSEGIATAAASLHCVENVHRTINPAQILCDQLMKPYEFAQAIAEPYTKFLDYARGPAAAILSQLHPSSDLFRSFNEQFFDNLFIELELHLIEEGWYLSIDLPESVLPDLADLHDQQKLEEIEQWLQRFYRQKVDDVESAVLSAFPHRLYSRAGIRRSPPA